jgi:hypothetical protein
MRRLRVLALATVAGCADPTALRLPADAEPMARPIQYATWWRMVEACSGRSGDLGHVQWYVMPYGRLEIGGVEYDGYWFGEGNRVILLWSKMNHGPTVRHEMLHALLGTGRHPREYFNDRCAAVVSCGSGCRVAEFDRGVSATAREVTSAALAVTVRIQPAQPRTSIDSGWVSFLVTATNPFPEPVWVRLSGDASFGYVLANAPGTYFWTEEPRWAFRAGESRSFVFDRQFPATRDSLWAFFDKRYTSPVLLEVLP